MKAFARMRPWAHRSGFGPAVSIRPVTADAFAFFGATGDLARKMIFPALHRLARTGRLAIPVIGVAFSGWDASSSRPRWVARPAPGLSR